MNKLYKIEKTFEVEKLKVNGIQIWPFLRIYYRNLNYLSINKSKKSNLEKIKRVKNVYYGLSNILNIKNFEYLLITDSLERRLVNGQYIDKISEHLINRLKNRILVIEQPVDFHYPLKKISYKKVISYDLISVLTKIFNFNVKEYSIKNEEILKNINKSFNINVNYKDYISKFLSYYYFFYKLLDFLNLKLIFINCYYNLSNIALIFAANQKGIKTVELQHGFISQKHEAYNIFPLLKNKLDSNFFPNYLLSFGDYVKKEINYISDDKIIPIGNYYLDYIDKYYKAEKEVEEIFINLRKKFKKIVVVASQYTVTDKLFDFIIKSASLNKDIVYLIFPRNEIYPDVNIENIKIFDNVEYLDIYKAIKFSDVHTTVYSTTAMEAPILGVPNILIDIDEYVTKIYKNFLPDISTQIINNPNKFVNLIINSKFDKNKLKESYKIFFASNHKKRIEKFLKGVIDEK